jgi:hypothetical protein
VLPEGEQAVQATETTGAQESGVQGFAATKPAGGQERGKTTGQENGQGQQQNIHRELPAREDKESSVDRGGGRQKRFFPRNEAGRAWGMKLHDSMRHRQGKKQAHENRKRGLNR